jgi:5'-methylthioadenosine phosphorylase
LKKIGIIGGSGLEDPGAHVHLDDSMRLKEAKEEIINTPYGAPSSPLTIGRVGNNEVIILSRHGKEHLIPPTKVNYRANIHALKQKGCIFILATTAVGSLREEIGRGDLVIVDQFIDFTRHRSVTFYDKFDPHKPTHTQMAEPFSKYLRELLIKTGKELGFKMHETGTVITIEGPRFSTKAESHMFRSWGADIINMSIAPEVILANEAGIPYGAVAMSTDYDCGKEDEEPVSWEQVLEVFGQNVEKVKQLLINTILKIK